MVSELLSYEHNSYDFSSPSGLTDDYVRRLSSDFSPSRGRAREGLLESAAVAVQRCGSTLPTLLPECCDAELALSTAASINPFDSALFANFATAIVADTEANLSSPEDVSALRAAVSERLVRLGRALEPFRQRRVARLPPAAPNRHLRFPLLHFLIIVFGYADGTLCADLSGGMHICGRIPFCPTLAPRVTHDKRSNARLFAGLENRYRRIIRAVRASLSRDTAAMWWELSMKEVDCGWLEPPSLVTDVDIVSTVLSPRFCIREQHGLNPAKFRLIDDLSRSWVNHVASMSDTYRPQSIDHLLAMCRLLGLSGAENLKLWSVDFANAYKTIPVRDLSRSVAHVVFANPADNGVYKARVLVQPFGSRSAPKNWGRVITCLQFLSSKLFRLDVSAYVDDVFTGEPGSYVESVFTAFKNFSNLVGLHTSDKKDQVPSSSIRVLGAEVTVVESGLRAEAGDRRKPSNCERIRTALADSSLSPACAGKLRGELGFLATLAFGKFGMSMLIPLSKRQYSTGPDALTPELRTCLWWWPHQIPDLVPRFVPFKFNLMFGAHSDAQGLGHAAVTIRIRSSVIVRSAHLPAWVLAVSRRSDDDSGILGFGFAAAILAICVLCALDLGRMPAGLLRVDNQGVLDSLIKGSSGSVLGAAMCGVFWNLAARSSAFVWLERVSSRANFADSPSRLCGLDGCTSSSFSWRQCPRSFLAIFSSFGNFLAAASGVNPDRLHVVPEAWADCCPPNPE